MKIHNNMNQMKSMGPTEAELQAAMKAAQNRKDIKRDDIVTEKIKKFKDRVAGAAEKQKNRVPEDLPTLTKTQNNRREPKQLKRPLPKSYHPPIRAILILKFEPKGS